MCVLLDCWVRQFFAASSTRIPGSSFFFLVFFLFLSLPPMICVYICINKPTCWSQREAIEYEAYSGDERKKIGRTTQSFFGLLAQLLIFFSPFFF